jgi:hypothetical protein
MRGKCPESRNGSVDRQRDQQQKSDGKHQRERKHSLLDEIDNILHPRSLCGRNFPNSVERVSQLDQHSGRAEEQCQKAEYCGENTVRRVAGPLQQGLNRLRSRGANEILHLPHNLELRRLAAKHESGDANRDEKQRGERKQGVKGQGSPEARAFVPVPLRKAFAQQRFDVAPAKGRERLAITAAPPAAVESSVPPGSRIVGPPPIMRL